MKQAVRRAVYVVQSVMEAEVFQSVSTRIWMFFLFGLAMNFIRNEVVAYFILTLIVSGFFFSTVLSFK